MVHTLSCLVLIFISHIHHPAHMYVLQCLCVFVENEPFFGNNIIDEFERMKKHTSSVDDNTFDPMSYVADGSKTQHHFESFKTSRCYCLLSTNPDFLAHYTFLKQLLDDNALQKQRMEGDIEGDHYNKLMWNYIHSSFQRRSSSVPYPALADSYISADDSDESGSANSTPAGVLEGIEIDDANISYQHILADDDLHARHLHKESESLLFTIKTLCAYLNIDNILTILAAVLAERSVIFYARSSTNEVDVDVLSFVVLSIIPLICPYEYQSVLMPVRLIEND